MSKFIVRLALHPSDKDQAHSAIHDAMAKAGFSRIYRDYDGVRYHLPDFEYCITLPSSAEAIRDLVETAARKVTTHFMTLVSETTRIAIAGLVPVKETTLPAEPAASALAPPQTKAA